MSKKSRKKKDHIKQAKTLTRKQISSKLRDIFNRNPNKPYNYKQLGAQLKLRDSASKQLVNQVLKDLATDKFLTEVSRGQFKLKSRDQFLTGKMMMTSRGYGFVRTDLLEDDVMIAQKNLHHALDGDEVRIFLYVKKKSSSPEGEVVEVLNQKRKSFVGTLEMSRNFAFLIPDNYKMPYDIFIHKDDLNGAKDGEKVIAEITEWPERAKNPYGKVVDILGIPGNNDTEMHAILSEFGLPYEFDKTIEKEAENIPDAISKEEIKKRRDFRKTTTFTIDPHDAKDFDDAISFKKLENGNFEVGIHIADVTHYVKSGSVLDREAYERGTSVYLVDRVVPMLPEHLSNGLCSLRPNEDKLTFSAVFEMDMEANVHNSWFGKTIINSDRRFTYEEAQSVIETGKGDLHEEIGVLQKIAVKLREKRFRQGSIALNRIEVGFEIDEKGVPLGVVLKEQKEANKLVEEYMLLANRSVAGRFKQKKGDKPYTSVYRVHEPPNPDKINQLSFFIKKFGYKIILNNQENLSQSINELIGQIEGKREQNLLEVLILRAMSKARYTVNNLGHYGLGFSDYTHFTSPIRRYPDMMVHRILQDALSGNKPPDAEKTEKDCKHCSEMEILATEAERASIKYKQVEYMSDKIGETFEGVISGVSHPGIFVELVESRCEGMVPMAELTDDFYEYDEENLCLIGRRSRKIYRLGDAVTVTVARADLSRKQLDFMLAEKPAR